MSSVEEIYPDLAVAVLAGGASSRFGSDKALFQLEPGGPALIERVISTARALSNCIAIIGHQRYGALDLGVPVIPDDEAARGPLSGIATALRHLERPRMLVVACDMPCLSIPLLRWMIARPSRAAVIIPRTDDGRWQTMHAIYRQSCLAAIEAQLSQGDGSVRSILDSLMVDVISEADLRAIDPGLDSLVSLNSPAEIIRARMCASQR